MLGIPRAQGNRIINRQPIAPSFRPPHNTVVPAKAGIQEIPRIKERAGYIGFWIPAFAGTTVTNDGYLGMTVVWVAPVMTRLPGLLTTFP